MGPTLLVVGGGWNALPALRWAREAGLATVLADPDPCTRARRAASEFRALPARDFESHAALARSLARHDRLAGVLVTEPSAVALLPALAEAVPGCLPPRGTLELLLSAPDVRAFLGSRGFAVREATAGRTCFDLFAFFRDGGFVPGGIAARRTLARGDVASMQPSGLDPERERNAYVLAERAARAMGVERGPLQVTLVEAEAGDPGLAFTHLQPFFADLLGATHVARLAHGKSPLQAWFAHLSGAGGPFDELALEPRAAAGWLSLAPEHAGFFAGADGVARARAVPGVVDLWLEEPGRELDPHAPEPRPLGYLWAEAYDQAELAERLLAARAALELWVARAPRAA